MMASRGITLVCVQSNRIPYLLSDELQFFVACEPALSGYSVSLCLTSGNSAHGIGLT